jgi:hypothetical protein
MGNRLLLADNRLAINDGRRPIFVSTASLKESMMKYIDSSLVGKSLHGIFLQNEIWSIP